jgi:hypothetical protein
VSLDEAVEQSDNNSNKQANKNRAIMLSHELLKKNYA